MSLPLSPAPAASGRRLLLAVGMVGAPVCLALGNLILPPAHGTAAQQLQAVHASTAAYLGGSVIDAAGFALLGAVGVGIATLLPRRGALLATIAALLTLAGGTVMGGAVLTTSIVEAALPLSHGAEVLAALQGSAAVGLLFQFSLLAAVGGLLGVVALLVGRPVSWWVPVLFLVGLLLTMAGGGVIGAVLTIPLLIATALLARALVRRSPVVTAAVEAPSERIAAA